MTVCSVKWCGKNSGTSSLKKNGITFHRFPKCPEQKSKWIEACSRGERWFPSNNSVICSRHFSEDGFYYMKDRRRIMQTVVPTLYLPVLTVPTETKSSSPNDDDNISKDALISEPDPLKLPIQTNISSPSKDHLMNTNILRNALILGPGLSSSKAVPTFPKNTVQPEKPETPKRKIPNSPSAYDSPTKNRLCRRVKELEIIVERKNKSLRQIRDRNRRLIRKIQSLKSLLNELEDKNLILAENSNILSSLRVKCKDILK